MHTSLFINLIQLALTTHNSQLTTHNSQLTADC